jgi:tetratricopeptide (TPR) repeat protein
MPPPAGLCYSDAEKEIAMAIKVPAVSVLAALVWCICAVPASAFDDSGCFRAPSAHVSSIQLIAILNINLADPNQTQPEKRACSYYGRGLLYDLEGDVPRALADYTSAVGWMATFADAYAARGDAEEELGQHDAAARDYSDAARLGGNSPGQLTVRCWIRALRGHPLAMALEDCNESLRLRPDNSGALTSRGLVYLRMGNYSASIADSDAALQKSPHDVASLYIRAIAKSHAGDVQGARADLAAARAGDSRVEDTFAIYGVKM